MSRTNKIQRTTSLWMLLGLTGCGAEGLAPDGEPSDGNQEVAQSDALSIGSSGSRVRAAHDYFKRYGYFPNAAVQEQHPAWRPVADAPARDDAFDSQTERATRAFQLNYGLTETGVIDLETQQLMDQPRCGFPDNVESIDEHAKWDHMSESWPTTNLTWKLWDKNEDGTPAFEDGMNFNVLRGWITHAFGQYSQASGFTFTEVFNNVVPNIYIWFENFATNNDPQDDGANGIAWPPTIGVVKLNTQVTWSYSDSPPAGSLDVRNVMIHEVGHALGLKHSGNSAAVMWPFTTNGNKDLKTDDITSSLAKKIEWTWFDGDRDLDTAHNRDSSGNNTLWLIGGADIAGKGRHVWRLKDWVTWELMPGGGKKIAVNPTGSASSRRPWVLHANLGDNIRRWDAVNANCNLTTPPAGGYPDSCWQTVNGCAMDIAVGSDNSVWITSCTAATTGGKVIKKLTGSIPSCNSLPNEGCWTAVGGTANDANPLNGGGSWIAVGKAPAGTPNYVPGEVVPWIVDSNKNIWRRSSGTSGQNAAWFQLPGKARDIGASDEAVWSIADGGPADSGIQAWRFNAATTGGQPPAVARSGWVTVPGGGVGISVGANGHPFVVNSNGAGYYAY
jgi:peptidoglycan hydrolase-like protein with peptidoglycan-binding domain